MRIEAEVELPEGCDYSDAWSLSFSLGSDMSLRGEVLSVEQLSEEEAAQR